MEPHPSPNLLTSSHTASSPCKEWILHVSTLFHTHTKLYTVHTSIYSTALKSFDAPDTGLKVGGKSRPSSYLHASLCCEVKGIMLGLHSKGNDLSNTCPDSSLGMSISASKWEDVYNLGTKSNVGDGLEATESRL